MLSALPYKVHFFMLATDPTSKALVSMPSPES
jgi:hypothetical protein